ncbi:MAG: hypothetical protein QXX77_08820 [Candidatus Methanosuratincola sp.]
MPKEGYSVITVPSDLYETIRVSAKSNQSISDHLRMIFAMTLVDYLRMASRTSEDRSVAGSNPASGTKEPFSQSEKASPKRGFLNKFQGRE